MKYDLSEEIDKEIRRIAKKNNMEKIVLFGSRARGDNTERSDIDIAVWGGSYIDLYNDIEENNVTLLSFDIIDMNSHISSALKEEIERDGVVIYEKNR